jgi:hypothetical protein
MKASLVSILNLLILLTIACQQKEIGPIESGKVSASQARAIAKEAY